MTSFRVAGASVDGRLDPHHYRPEFARAVLSVSNVHDCEAVRSESFIEWIGQPSDIREYADTGVAILNAGDVRPLQVATEGLRVISKSLAASHQRQTLLGNEALIVRTGANCGDCAFSGDRVRGLLVNSHVIPIRPNGAKVDPAYLATFLATRTGQTLLDREMTGSAQRQISVQSLRDTLVLVPSIRAQRYIGDKVRQAERLRENARRMLHSVRQHHASLIPPFRPTRKKWNTFRLRSSAVDDVVVPHFYPPAVTEYLAGRDSRSLSQLCDTLYSGETYDPDDQGVDQATSRSCTGRFLRRPCNRVRSPARTELDLQPHDLLLTNAAHDKGYIGTDITYYHGGPRNIPSAKVMVLRPNRALVPASYLFTYLQMPVGYLQIQSAIRGISAGIRAQDVAMIRIPMPTLAKEAQAAWEAMDTQMAEAGAAEETAGLLCAAATQVVEHLIDGRLNEADLVAAQKALEAGDRSADREILKALRQTDAPDAKPLIADVDALYALLDEPEGQDA